MKKKLIINADDFGYSSGVNYGIIDAHRFGMLTSTTLMTNMPGVSQAVDLAKRHPGLGVGVHLVLTCGRPLLSNHQTIVDVKGDFRNIAFYKGSFNVDLNEIYEEWKAQIERFLSFGLTPTHLDSHHHVNSMGDIPDVFLSLASEYGLPVRNNMDEDRLQRYKHLKTTDTFAYHLESALKNRQAITDLFDGRQSVEVMTHPAYLDKFLLSNSSYTYPRVDELEFLTNKDLVQIITSLSGIQLSTFDDL